MAGAKDAACMNVAAIRERGNATTTTPIRPDAAEGYLSERLSRQPRQ